MKFADPAAPACRICANDRENRIHDAREMMYGLRDPYAYLECAACGCVQLLDPPGDMEAAYPGDYYSYGGGDRRRLAALDAALKRLRAGACLGEGGPATRVLGSLLLRIFGSTPQLRWMKRMGIRRDDPVLDVGCGAGDLLRELQRDGFRNLTGADPYIGADIDHGGGLRIRKASLPDLDASYALIMLHHSFEHMDDPASVLRHLHRLLRPGGRVLIRIPVADGRAWRDYGVDWVQLDAPRHLYLHTRRSLEILAGPAGFTIDRIDCDSTGFQFWGSELYRRDIALREEDDRGRSGSDRFTAAELAEFERRAAELNAEGEGDQAAVYLRRAGD